MEFQVKNSLFYIDFQIFRIFQNILLLNNYIYLIAVEKSRLLKL